MEIKRTYNPLTLDHDYKTFENEGLSPIQFLERENIVFTRPVILLVNGQPILRKNWVVELNKTDICHFVELPRGGDADSNPLQMIAMIALVVLSAYTGGLVTGPLLSAMAQGIVLVGGSLLINSFFAENISPDGITRSESERPIDVYNLNSMRNTLQIGQPFAEHFGRFKCHPALVQVPYTKYIDNNQYLYFLGIIGVGEYDIENIYVGDKLADDYSEINYNIIEPSGILTICPEIVYTAVIGLEISTDWLSIIITPPLVKAYKFEFDIVCPSGLHEINSTTGDVFTYEVTIELNYRTVDDTGNGTSVWSEFFTKVYSAATRDPIRHTIEKIVLEGNDRYEFRFKRTVEKSSDPLISDAIFFESARAFGPEHPDYGDITLIELSILATDQINNSTANDISVIATRKLYPVTTTGFGATKTVTRSIIDACAYIVSSDNGGKQPDSIFEFESLTDLKTDLATRENWFDHRFLNRTTVMNACTLIAQCGRSVPYMPGGLFSLVRDKLQTVSTQVYTDDDYTENSLTLDHIIRTEDDATCVEITYTDPNTWQKEKIQYYEVGGSDENPAKLALIGCTSRQHAYEEAAYLYKSDDKVRTKIVFTTGLKGHIPKLGDMVYVSSRHIDWGQTGQIAHISTTVATLSEPVNFGETTEEGKLILTSKTGGVLGTYTVTLGETAHTVNVCLTPSIVNTIYDQGLTATKFVFGLTVEEILRIRILKILPSSNNEIRISGSLADDSIHDDPGTVPELVIIQPNDEDIIIDDPDPTDGVGYIYGGYGHPTILGYELQDCDEYNPTDIWTNKTDMPVPARESLAGTTINDSGYVFGGTSAYTVDIQDCDEYTPDTWVCKTNVPAPARSAMSTSTINTAAYTYGGYSFSTTSNTPDCDQYTPDVWVSKTNMTGDLKDSTAASTIGSSGYVYGGWNTVVGIELEDCYQYTPDVWVQKTNIPLPARCVLTAMTIGSSGYICGGSGGESIVDYLIDCDEYTPDVWTSKADMFSPKRGLLAASAIGDSGYIYGGYTDDPVSCLQDCDQYILNTWVSKADIPLPARHGLAASTII